MYPTSIIFRECLNFLTWYVAPAISAFGIIGNLLTIVVLCDRRMRSSVFVYLSGLAAFDIVLLICATGLFSISFEGASGTSVEAVQLHQRNVTSINENTVQNFFPRMMDSLRLAVLYPIALTAQTATIWITVCLTAERYVAGCHPLRASLLSTVPKARLALFGCTIAALVYNIPRWFEMSHIKMNFNDTHDWTQICNEKGLTFCYWHALFYLIYYTWGYLFVMFLVPLIAILVMNIKLIQALRKSDQFHQNHYSRPASSQAVERSSNPSISTTITHQYSGGLNHKVSSSLLQTLQMQPFNSSEKKETAFPQAALGQKAPKTNTRIDRSVTRIVIVVVSLFIVCQLPAMVYNIYFGIVSPRHVPDGWCSLSEVRNFLVVFHSSINFVVYCCMGAKFRRNFVRVITPCLLRYTRGNTTGRSADMNDTELRVVQCTTAAAAV